MEIFKRFLTETFEGNEILMHRKNILKQIDKELHKHKKVCLVGYPGVGKTSCVNEYARKKLSETKLQKVIWFDADSQKAIIQSVIKTAQQNIDGNLNDFKECLKILLEFLNNEEKILVIFDNLEDINDLIDILDLSYFNVPYIITTKNEVETSFYLPTIDVLPFTKEEARKYLTKELPKNNIQKIIDYEPFKNEYLPYKLSLIAQILNCNKSISIEKCMQSKASIELIGRMIKPLEGEFNDVIKILNCARLLDTNYIQIGILECLRIEKPLKEVIEKIKNFGFCQLGYPGPGEFGISVHQIFQDDLKSFFEFNNNNTEVKEELVLILNKLFPNIKENYTSYNPAFEYKTHIVKLLDCVSEENEIIAELRLKLGSYYSHVTHEYKKAKEEIIRSLEIRRRLFGPYHFLVAESIESLGSCLNILGYYNEAHKHFLAALEIRRRIENDESDIASSMLRLGIACFNIGEDLKALDYCEKALETLQKSSSEPNENIAKGLRAIATIYFGLDNLEKAYEFHDKAFKMRSKLFKSDHPDIADSLFFAGRLNLAFDKKSASLDYSLKALDMLFRLNRGDSPIIVNLLDYIGSIYLSFQNLKKAKDYIFSAYEMAKRLFDENHYYFASIFKNIGFYYFKKNDCCNDPMSFILKSLKINQGLYKYHPNISKTLNMIGTFFISSRNYTTALKYHLEALEISKKLCDGINSEVANSLNYLAYCYYKFGNKTTSLELNKQAFEMRQKVYKNDKNICTAEYLMSIAHWYRFDGKHDQAEEYYSKAKQLKLQFLRKYEPEIGENFSEIIISNFEIEETFFSCKTNAT